MNEENKAYWNNMGENNIDFEELSNTDFQANKTEEEIIREVAEEEGLSVEEVREIWDTFKAKGVRKPLIKKKKDHKKEKAKRKTAKKSRKKNR